MGVGDQPRQQDNRQGNTSPQQQPDEPVKLLQRRIAFLRTSVASLERRPQDEVIHWQTRYEREVARGNRAVSELLDERNAERRRRITETE